MAPTLPVATLTALLLFKGLAWGLSLSAFRGGPTFPAMFLGLVGRAHRGQRPRPVRDDDGRDRDRGDDRFDAPPAARVGDPGDGGDASGLSTAPLIIVSVVVAYIVTERLGARRRPPPVVDTASPTASAADRDWRAGAGLSPSGATDVVVIGGGIIGVASAAHLAADGAAGRAHRARRPSRPGHPDGTRVSSSSRSTRSSRTSTSSRSRDIGRSRQVARNGFALADAPAGLLCVGQDEGAARRLAAELEATHPGLGPAFLARRGAHRLEPSLAPAI